MTLEAVAVALLARSFLELPVLEVEVEAPDSPFHHYWFALEMKVVQPSGASPEILHLSHHQSSMDFSLLDSFETLIFQQRLLPLLLQWSRMNHEEVILVES